MLGCVSLSPLTPPLPHTADRAWGMQQGTVADSKEVIGKKKDMAKFGPRGKKKTGKGKCHLFKSWRLSKINKCDTLHQQ